MITPALRRRLDELLARCGRSVERDPVSLVRPFQDPSDREVAGLLASGLAFGSVTHVLRSVSTVLAVLGRRPAERIRRAGLADDLRGFRHRWLTGADIAAMLEVVGRIHHGWGGVEPFFLDGFDPERPDLGAALDSFSRRTKELARDAGRTTPGLAYLFPEPAGGSAVKRLCLFLRWMARPDDGIDLGIWSGLPASALVIPLDTHVLRISRAIGLTKRRTASFRTALDVTASLRRICPEDPTRYDFAIAQLGITRGCRHRHVPELCTPCPLAPHCTLQTITES